MFVAVQVVYRRYEVCLAVMIARRISMFFTVILVTLCFFHITGSRGRGQEGMRKLQKLRSTTL